MGPLTFPAGREVVLDSNAIIYSVEQVEPYWSLLRPLWKDAAAGRVRLLASEIVIPEVLSKPIQSGDASLVAGYEAVLSPPSMGLLRVTWRLLRDAADLRASGGYGTPDAIIAATAAARGAALVTNDRRLRNFAGAEVRYLRDLLP